MKKRKKEESCFVKGFVRFTSYEEIEGTGPIESGREENEGGGGRGLLQSNSLSLQSFILC